MPKRATSGRGYYAVRNGWQTGVYTTWSECQLHVNGYSGAQFKRFDTMDEAQSYIGRSDLSRFSGPYGSNNYRSNNNSGAGNKSSGVQRTSRSWTRSSVLQKSTRPSDWKTLRSAQSSTAQNEMVVYTDGASSKNGCSNARAGVGVWFGHNDPRNVSKPLAGPRQTNQRAELSAIQEALIKANEIDPSGSQRVRIYTDSKYSIDSLTKWSDKWEQNGWKTTAGTQVENQDLIRPIREMMSQRTVHLEHVRGHTGIEGNEGADQLAQRGAMM